MLVGSRAAKDVIIESCLTFSEALRSRGESALRGRVEKTPADSTQSAEVCPSMVQLAIRVIWQSGADNGGASLAVAQLQLTEQNTLEVPWPTWPPRTGKVVRVLRITRVARLVQQGMVEDDLLSSHQARRMQLEPVLLWTE